MGRQRQAALRASWGERACVALRNGRQRWTIRHDGLVRYLGESRAEAARAIEEIESVEAMTGDEYDRYMSAR